MGRDVQRSVGPLQRAIWRLAWGILSLVVVILAAWRALDSVDDASRQATVSDRVPSPAAASPAAVVPAASEGPSALTPRNTDASSRNPVKVGGAPTSSVPANAGAVVAKALAGTSAEMVAALNILQMCERVDAELAHVQQARYEIPKLTKNPAVVNELVELLQQRQRNCQTISAAEAALRKPMAQRLLKESADGSGVHHYLSAVKYQVEEEYRPAVLAALRMQLSSTDERAVDAAIQSLGSIGSSLGLTLREERAYQLALEWWDRQQGRKPFDPYMNSGLPIGLQPKRDAALEAQAAADAAVMIKAWQRLRPGKP